MLLRFKVCNYRSIRDEAVLDFEAVGLADSKDCLLKYKNKDYLPVISINGKNGGGKSNVIRAMWLAVQFIKNAQRTQHEGTEVPVRPFELDDTSKEKPSAFSFEYVNDGIWYDYGFSATRNEITEEHLYSAPKGQKSVVFEREYQKFIFPSNNEKRLKEMISKAVASNQLYFPICCTMNYEPTIKAMKWFRNKLFFSRDYSDLGKNIIEYSEDTKMLQSVVNIAKIADLGISDMHFEINNKVFSNVDELPDDISLAQKEAIEKAMNAFRQSLSGDADTMNSNFQYNELKAISMHKGLDIDGKVKDFPLGLNDESDGTIRLMARATAMEAALRVGGVFIIDEIEDRIHPLLVEYIINRFQKHNTGEAQLVFTTHSIDIMYRNILRRDQYYLVDKDSKSGASSLYSVADFSVRNDEKIGKAYLIGKYRAIPFVMED